MSVPPASQPASLHEYYRTALTADGITLAQLPDGVSWGFTS